MRACFQRGFTLIEVLVALVVMSIMALLSWQGIEGISRASFSHRERSNTIATVQTALSQWKLDLDQMIDAPSLLNQGVTGAGSPSNIKPIEFDGRVLRITRRFANEAQAGLVSLQEWRVVAWGLQSIASEKGEQTRWMRWVSDPVVTRGQWQSAWNAAGRWGQNPTEAERAKQTDVLGAESWQIFYYRNDAWSNPQSSADSAQNNSTLSSNPDGIRLILKLSNEQLPGGTLSIDWVQATRGGGRG